MMRFFLAVLMIGIIAFFPSCGGTPETVIPQEKMKLILYDVMRAQEYAALKYGNDTFAVNKNLVVMLQQVFNIHKINKDDFYSSFHYYEAHPDENQVLFDSLTAYTKQKQQDIYSHLR